MNNFNYNKTTAKSGAAKGLEMKMSGQAKGACFNKAVDAAIAVFNRMKVDAENADEMGIIVVELTKNFFEAFKPINMEEESKTTGGPF